MLPLFEAHDRSAVQVYAYSNSPRSDVVTRRFQAVVSQWCDAVKFSDAELAQKIKEDRIDILVDCSGHTHGNRLNVFCFKPAPVLVTWLGYPCTTGLKAIDIRITDAQADPIGMADNLHSEKVVRLPHGYHTYAPLVPTPDPHKSSANEEGSVTFGAFHNLSNFSDPAIALWASVLSAVPQSRLALKTPGLSDAHVAERITRRFADNGIGPDRLLMMPWRGAYGTHFDDLNHIDIALDATPYNGTTTTCEALWMGVPVVTLCQDERPASRVGGSLLTQIGHPEWIATSDHDYVRIATSLAADRNQLAAVRKTLRQDLLRSPLGDAALFARAIEEAYRTEWQGWCKKQTG
jgi:protein O-GlcNAc transferase